MSRVQFKTGTKKALSYPLLHSSDGSVSKRSRVAQQRRREKVLEDGKKRPLEEGAKAQKICEGAGARGFTLLPVKSQGTCGHEGRYHRRQSEKWG